MADAKTAQPPGKDDAGAAKGKGATAPAGAKDAPKKRNLKPIIMVGAAVLLLAGAAAGAYRYFANPGADAAASDAGGAKDKTAAKDKGKDSGKEKDKEKSDLKVPFFVEFEPFTVNLKDPEKFLQIKLTFQVKSVDAAESMKNLMPIVRSAVIPVLGSQDAAELMAPDGKEKLCAAVALAANKSIAGRGMDDAVDTVLITHMIIQ
jgi:flagellar FliL protein